MVSVARQPSTAPSEAGAQAEAPTKRARIWWLVHQWAGLKFSVLLSFILLTGTLAVFSHEMDWLMRPAMRVSPSSVAGPPDWSAIARQAALAHPDREIQSIDAPIASAFAATITTRRPDRGLAFLYAHPTTGAIQGEGHWVGAARVLRNMHRHLNMPVWLGVPIVSSLAFLLLVSLVTSLVVYKKWWRGFTKPIRTRNARTGWGDFHRLAGAWSLWFLLLIIATSLWYLVESVGGEAPRTPSAKAAGIEASTSELAALLPAALATARAADPQLEILRIGFPDDADGAFKFEGQRSAWLVRDRVNAVFVEARTARALLVTDGGELNAHQRISEAADPLHFGTFGDYWTKGLWFIAGCLLTALSVSGVALYSMRLLKTKQIAGQSGSILARAWRGMSIWRYPAVALVIAGFILLPNLWDVS